MRCAFLPGPSYHDAAVREVAGWVAILDEMQRALLDMQYSVFTPHVEERHIHPPHRVMGYSLFAAAQVAEQGPFDLLVGAPGYAYGAMLAQPQACRLVYVWNNADPYRRRQLEPEWRTTPLVIPEAREARAKSVVDLTYEELNSQALHMAHHVIACSPWVKKTHAEVVPADSISVAFWGVDSNMFHWDCEANMVWGAPPLRVLFVGGDPVRKGLCYLLAALDTGMELTLVGTDLRVRGTHCLGMVPWSQMPQVYREADVLVCPTVEDGIALCVQEAMASGVVPIATPEAAEVFENGVSGIRVPYRDAGAIAKALRQLRDDPNRLMKMSREAIRLAKQQTWEGFRRDFQEVVRRQVRRHQFELDELPLPDDVGVFESKTPWLKEQSGQ